MRNILVPLSPAQSAKDRFEVLYSIAEADQLSVTFLTVIEVFGSKHRSYFPHDDANDLNAELTQTYLSKLEADVEALRTGYTNIEFNVAVRTGVPVVEIVKYAVDEHFDLIAVDVNQGHKKRATQMGSNTRHLIRKSPVPVMALTGQVKSCLKKVVAAVDLDPPSEAGATLNEMILKEAKSLALNQNAELHIFHAWRIPHEGFLRHRSDYDDEAVAELKRSEQGNREQALHDLKKRSGLAETDSIDHIVSGRIVSELPDFISLNGIDLLVMGTVCRTGIPGFVIGNTAESIIDSVDCSVLALKPPGFQSPVYS